MIVTTYTPDGTKTRKPVGYAGDACNAATQPYEQREFGTVKTRTADADRNPEDRVATEETVNVGG